ncbi:SRPBCC family protein [Streptomyces abyssomicinicus]|uniref:SRPBCC family protein n=1 Tax=Streptomyces abyssomicinicus TaxID=574929 RepID=UPI00124F9029|nr:SRPBCC family protein [Streptomyces abyssomicinicus]
MAKRHRLIRATPEEVWGILADGGRYADWVVGTARSRPVRGDWPEVGAAITYEIRLGPLRLHNETVVRRCLPGRELELEAKAGPLGTARIALELRSWGDDTLIIVDEHPLQGAGGKIHNVAVEALIQLRHREMLRRLEEVCEEACRRDGGRPGLSDQGRVRPAGA